METMNPSAQSAKSKTSSAKGNGKKRPAEELAALYAQALEMLQSGIAEGVIAQRLKLSTQKVYHIKAEAYESGRLQPGQRQAPLVRASTRFCGSIVAMLGVHGDALLRLERIEGGVMVTVADVQTEESSEPSNPTTETSNV